MTVLLHWLNAFTTSVIQSGGYWGIIFSMALESFMVPIPSEIILPFGGYLASAGKLSVLGVIFSGAIGGTIGSVGLYYASMFFGNKFIKKWGRYFLISERHLEMTSKWFDEYGDFAIFVTRLLPVVRGLISIPAGISKMNVWTFTLYTFVGTFIWSTILAYFGFQMGLSNVGMQVIWEVTFAIAGVAVAMYVMFRLAKKHFKIFSILASASLWATLGFFVFYALYISYAPIKANELNYSNWAKINQRIKNSQNFTFAVIGDTFRNPKMLYKASSATSTFILSLGNMLYSGDKAKYRLLVHELSDLKKPFLTVVGTNELSDEGYKNYYKIFGDYNYAVPVGNTYFVMLNDVNGKLPQRQMSWLSQELTISSTYSHHVVAMNIPASWMNSNGAKLSKSASHKLEEILKSRKVDLILAVGESATVSDNPVPYAIVGKNAYLIVNVNENRIRVKVKKTFENFHNEFIQAVSVYLYSMLILDWPFVGIFGIGLVLVWFFWKRYDLIVKIKKKNVRR